MEPTTLTDLAKRTDEARAYISDHGWPSRDRAAVWLAEAIEDAVLADRERIAGLVRKSTMTAHMRAALLEAIEAGGHP